MIHEYVILINIMTFNYIDWILPYIPLEWFSFKSLIIRIDLTATPQLLVQFTFSLNECHI